MDLQHVLSGLGNGEFLDLDSLVLSLNLTFGGHDLQVTTEDMSTFTIAKVYDPACASFSVDFNSITQKPRVLWIPEPPTDVDLMVATDVLVGLAFKVFKSSSTNTAN